MRMPHSLVMRMPHSLVLILGAGATRACHGPLTNEILYEAFRVAQRFERQDYVDLVDCCLRDVFHVAELGARTKMSYPGLPLLMSLIDAAIDRGQPLGWGYDAARLRDVRAALEYLIFAVLEDKLRSGIPDFHSEAIDRLFPAPKEPRIISLNYDIIIDNTLAARSQERMVFPDYGCDVQTAAYQRQTKFGRLLKLHGSLNGLYCPSCQRLDVAVSQSGLNFSKALYELYSSKDGNLERRYAGGGSPCPSCETVMRPVMITPTQKKDYRNPHIAQVWYKAEEMLRDASSVVFIGYSIPGDDVEVVYLLKRGLAHLPASRVTVVEWDEQSRGVDNHEVGQRYQSIFGRGINWHTCGFEGWLQELANESTGCKGVPARSRVPGT